MADNVTIDPGSSPSIAIATDEGSDGKHYQKIKLFDPTADSVTGIGIAANPMRTDPTGSTAQPVTDNGGALTVDDGGSSLTVDDGGTSLTVDGTVSVSGTVATAETKASTGTFSAVPDSATSGTLLAANASRLGGTIFNDSSALLYVLWGAGTASSTNYSVRVYSNGYVTIPANYTGIVVGIWASDPGDGAARVSEFTA